MEEYQFTFDDIQFAEALAKQPGRTAFIDECGSFGFDFEKAGVLSHYVVCRRYTHIYQSNGHCC